MPETSHQSILAGCLPLWSNKLDQFHIRSYMYFQMNSWFDDMWIISSLESSDLKLISWKNPTVYKVNLPITSIYCKPLDRFNPSK